jgi:small subunit ribosomal protein S9
MTTAKTKENKYFEGIGRRKESIARVRITEAERSSFIVNDKKIEEYFDRNDHQIVAHEALDNAKAGNFVVTVKVSGGGISSQAEAVRLGIARALVKFKAELRGELKKAGFLKRDPRAVERKKFGLRKARRAPQWSKR